MYTADLDFQTIPREPPQPESGVKPLPAVVTTSNTRPSGPAIAAAWSAKATLAWNLLELGCTT